MRRQRPALPQYPTARNVVLTRNSTIQYSVHNIIAWVNRTLHADVRRIEEMGSGAAYCNLMDVLFENVIRMNRVKWICAGDKDFVWNFKILQQAFMLVKVEPPMDVNEIIKRGYKENYKFANWFRAFFDANFRRLRDGYDATRARSYQEIGFGISPTPRPAYMRRQAERRPILLNRRPALTVQSLRTMQPLPENGTIIRSSTFVMDKPLVGSTINKLPYTPMPVLEQLPEDTELQLQEKQQVNSTMPMAEQQPIDARQQSEADSSVAVQQQSEVDSLIEAQQLSEEVFDQPTFSKHWLNNESTMRRRTYTALHQLSRSNIDFSMLMSQSQKPCSSKVKKPSTMDVGTQSSKTILDGLVPVPTAATPKARVLPQRIVRPRVFDNVGRRPRVDSMVWLELPRHNFQPSTPYHSDSE